MNGAGAVLRNAIPALAAALALSGAIAAASPPEPMRYALLVAMDESSEESTVVAHQELAALLRDRYGFKTDELYDKAARQKAVFEAIFGVARGLGGARRAATGDDVLIVLTLPSMKLGADWSFVPADAVPDQAWTLISRLEIAKLFGGWSSVEGPNVLLVLPICDSDEDTIGKAISAITYCPQKGMGSTFWKAFVAVLEENAGRALTPALLADLLDQRAPSLRVRYSGARKSVTLTPRISFFDAAADRLQKAASPEDRLAALREVAERLGGRPVDDRSQDGLERLEARTLDLLHDPPQPSNVRVAAISTLGYLRSNLARPILDSILAGAGDAEERRAALQALAKIGGEPLSALLQRAFKDPDPTVRREAVSLAGLRGEAVVVPELLAIADADPDERVRVTALQTLAILDPGDRRKTAITLMQKLVDDPSLEIRREALATLGALGGTLPGKTLLSLTRQEDPAFRQALAYATPKLFEESDRQRVVKALTKAAESKNPPDVRVASLWALGEIGGVAAERTLSRAIHDEQESVRAAAAEGLGKIPSEDAIPELANALLKDTPTVKVAAAQALGAIGDAHALEPLFLAFKDEDVYVRSAAEASLQRIKSQPQPGELVSQLADPSSSVRLAAVKLLAESRSPAVIAPLIDKLADDDFYIRQVAIEGLGRHRNQACLRALIQTLNDPNFLKRQGAAAALSVLGGAEAEHALALEFDDPNPAVRSEIVRSLDKLESSKLELFLVAAKDEDASVRFAAVEALIGFGAPAALRALEELARDDVPQVRLRAIAGLREEAGRGDVQH